MSQGVALVARARGRVAGARRSRGGYRVLGAGVGLALTLTGCTANPPHQVIQSNHTQPPVSPTPSPSATGVVAPARPPEMDRTDEVGALAAVEYFLQLHEWVYASGDLNEWEAVSGQTCDFCASVHRTITDAYGSGGSIDTGVVTFSGVAVVGFDEQLQVYAVRVTYAAGESSVRAADGSVTRVMPAEEGVLVLDVGPSVRGWQLLGAEAGGV